MPELSIGECVSQYNGAADSMGRALRTNPINLSQFDERTVIYVTGKSLSELYRAAGTFISGEEIKRQAQHGGNNTAFKAQLNNLMQQCGQIICLEQQYMQCLQQQLAEKRQAMAEMDSAEMRKSRRDEYDAVEREIKQYEQAINAAEQRAADISTAIEQAISNAPDVMATIDVHFNAQFQLTKQNMVEEMANSIIAGMDKLSDTVKAVLEEAKDDVQNFVKDLADECHEKIEQAENIVKAVISSHQEHEQKSHGDDAEVTPTEQRSAAIIQEKIEAISQHQVGFAAVMQEVNLKGRVSDFADKLEAKHNAKQQLEAPDEPTTPLFDEGGRKGFENQLFSHLSPHLSEGFSRLQQLGEQRQQAREKQTQAIKPPGAGPSLLMSNGHLPNTDNNPKPGGPNNNTPAPTRPGQRM